MIAVVAFPDFCQSLFIQVGRWQYDGILFFNVWENVEKLNNYQTTVKGTIVAISNTIRMFLMET